MLLQRLILLVSVGLSAGSLFVMGCTPQSTVDTSTEENSVSAQAETTNSPTAQAQTETQTAPETEATASPDVIYVPTPDAVVAEMLKVANVTKDDVVYDLGSGDGRIVITAAKERGAQGVGIDVDPKRIEEARQNAKEAGVTDRVQFLQQDLFQTDISDATVVTLYLLPDLNVRLRPKLFKELKPGTRIVSHDFDMREWKPEQVIEVDGPARKHTVYYWVVPETVPENLQG